MARDPDNLEGAVKAPSIHIYSKGKLTEDLIDSAIRHWKHNWPDEYKKFAREIGPWKARCAYFGKFTNIVYADREKQAEIVGNIPTHLFDTMVAVFGPDWTFDEDVRNKFWFQFDLGRIRKEKPGRPGPNERRR